jgi:beta-lactamase class A
LFNKKNSLKKYRILVAFLVLVILTSCKRNNPKISIDDLKMNIEDQFEKLDGDFAYVFFNLSNPEQIITINADEKFHAASTMKTPVMIEIYKQAASGKFSLTDSILVKNEFKSIVDGSSYKMDITDDSGEKLYDQIDKKATINDLLYDMITVSSNLATNILIDLVDAKSVTLSMRELGAENIDVLRGVEDIKAFEQGLSNSTTARDLMIIMKSIANGTAGNPEDCEQMIDILKGQNFNDMIPKYFPDNVKVAHKTGSITGVHHDSGIVYLADGRSFVLVILSKNLTDFKKETDAMAKISKETLDYMLQ